MTPSLEKAHFRYSQTPQLHNLLDTENQKGKKRAESKAKLPREKEKEETTSILQKSQKKKEKA